MKTKKVAGRGTRVEGREKKYVLISVYDKTGLALFAKELKLLGFEFVALG